jgi:hypothetical protein
MRNEVIFEKNHCIILRSDKNKEEKIDVIVLDSEYHSLQFLTSLKGDWSFQWIR